MGSPAFKLARLLHIKNLGAAIHAGRHNHVGGGPFKPGYTFTVTEGTHATPRFSFPDVQTAITVAAGHIFTIGAEAHGGHPVGVLLDLVYDLTGFSGKNSQQTIRATVGNKTLIGTDIAGQHHIQIIAYLKDFLTLGNIPHR